MRWPSLWASDSEKHDKKVQASSSDASPKPAEYLDSLLHQKDDRKAVDWTSTLNSTDWTQFTELSTVIPTVFLTTLSIGFYGFYRSYLRRIPAAAHINPGFFRKRSIFGKVTSVGDGDNFRVYHTPGGRLAGWGLWRKVPEDKKELQHRTIHVRLAGIDAPELSHFGRPAQPFSQEALEWLTKYVLHRRVRAYPYRRDQYERVVASVYTRKGLFRRDIGLEMLKAGLATVYEAKSGAEFGVGLEEKYRKAEWWAKFSKRGMWATKQVDFESPRQYKTRMAEQDAAGSKQEGRFARFIRSLSPKR